MIRLTGWLPRAWLQVAEDQRKAELGRRLHLVAVGAWYAQDDRLRGIQTETEAEMVRGMIVQDLEDVTGEAPEVWATCPLRRAEDPDQA